MDLLKVFLIYFYFPQIYTDERAFPVWGKCLQKLLYWSLIVDNRAKGIANVFDCFSVENC